MCHRKKSEDEKGIVLEATEILTQNGNDADNSVITCSLKNMRSRKNDSDFLKKKVSKAQPNGNEWLQDILKEVIGENELIAELLRTLKKDFYAEEMVLEVEFFSLLLNCYVKRRKKIHDFLNCFIRGTEGMEQSCFGCTLS